ncbi:MAG: TOBE domain-containing protein, partial [Alphaproteobacteria bacterium]|nr:TOBE domain-containing protein [Alphaproteobacteria bacterium]
AAPHELYFQPATLFVAGFVGDSNLIAGVVRHRAGGCATVEGPGGCRIEAATRRRPVALGQTVTLMIRPESLHLTVGADGGPGGIAGVVESVLFAGSLMKVFLRRADGGVLQVKMLTPRGAAGELVGKPAAVSWSPRDVVLFDEKIAAHG